MRIRSSNLFLTMRWPALAVTSLVLALAWTLAPGPALAGDNNSGGLEPSDYYAFRFVSDPRVAPDGSRVAFVKTTIDDERRGRDSAIWMVDATVDATADASPRRFTRGDSDRSPRWSPDGSKLGFLATRNDNTQLHLMAADGGEARAVTGIEQGAITNWAWLPDNRRVLLVLNLDPEVDDPTEKAAEDDEPDADVRRFSRAVYKTDAAGILDERRRGLWLADTESGELERLTGDAEWNDHNPVIAPDGGTIAFNADRTGGEFDGGFNQDIHLLDLDTRETTRLDTPAGRSQGPVFSPDGQSLAFRHQDDRYEPTRVIRIHIERGDTTTVHDGLEFSAASLHWPEGAADPRVLADYRGGRVLFDLEGDEPVALTDSNASVADPQFDAAGQRLVYTLEDETRLAEVHTAGADGSEMMRLTGFNDALLEERAPVALARFEFENEAGLRLDGFVVRPRDFDAGQRWPVILNIKGGPAGMWGHQWFHEFQMMAAAGYAVIFVNYRGSTGYGHEFQAAVRAPAGGADYGGPDYRDNMALVDAALERFDWMDGDRLFVTGGSHGGFLTNWITTRTDRFRAAVTQRSVSNWISEAGTQAYPPAAMQAEFDGTLWDNFDAYWDRSPLKYADQVTTPTLIIHGSDDHITPIGQGHEWFYALLNNDVEVEMAQFSGEGHGLSRGGTPVNLVKRLELILEWFAQHDPGP